MKWRQHHRRCCPFMQWKTLGIGCIKGITMGVRCDHFPLRALERLVVNKFPRFVPEKKLAFRKSM
jgi:hypothetical protein